MAHDEWKKSLSDGRGARYMYDETAEVCSSKKVSQNCSLAAHPFDAP